MYLLTCDLTSFFFKGDHDEQVKGDDQIRSEVTQRINKLQEEVDEQMQRRAQASKALGNFFQRKSSCCSFTEFFNIFFPKVFVKPKTNLKVHTNVSNSKGF